jgi:hypothetical protein
MDSKHSKSPSKSPKSSRSPSRSPKSSRSPRSPPRSPLSPGSLPRAPITTYEILGITNKVSRKSPKSSPTKSRDDLVFSLFGK